MTTKRFILMLLVMLGSVAGAWAEETIEKKVTIVPSSGQRIYNVIFSHLQVQDSKTLNLYINRGRYISRIQCEYGTFSIQGAISGTGYWDNKYGLDEIETTITFDPADLYHEDVTLYIKIPHDHTYAGTYYRYDENKHYKKCITDDISHEWCGSEISENHTYAETRESGVAYYTCNDCGYVNEKRKHEHLAADAWSADATQHWHACSGNTGMCDANGKLDLANHTYGGISVDDATAYYTCAVCGYVSNTRKAEYDALDFLSMKAVDAPMTIGMVKTGSPADYDLQYSLDRTHWTTVALTATNSNIVEIPTGQTCYFRHGTETVLNKLSNNQSNLWTFTMTGDGSVEAGGNVMSLLDITCQKNTLSVQHVFNSLFKGCVKLTKAPKLPATSLGEYCYWSMFEGTSITEVPELPATSVRTGSYLSMFKDCKQLTCITGGNVLSFTSLAGRACKEMFMGCENLTSVTLNNITTIDSRDNSDGSFYNWLEGTAIDTEGVLIAPDALVGNPLISLPQNWQYKQIKDYTTAVSNAMEGTTNFIQDIGEDYITQIKQATSNASALSLRNEALSDINTLKKYNSKLDASSFTQPTGVGMRLKVTKKDGNIYEFKTQDVESVDYYRVNE